MKELKRTFEVRRTVLREIDSEKIIFEKYEDQWIYHAPNAQNHTVEQLEIILSKLKELNEEATHNNTNAPGGSE